jgi:hypothetical protein
VARTARGPQRAGAEPGHDEANRATMRRSRPQSNTVNGTATRPLGPSAATSLHSPSMKQAKRSVRLSTAIRNYGDVLRSRNCLV